MSFLLCSLEVFGEMYCVTVAFPGYILYLSFSEKERICSKQLLIRVYKYSSVDQWPVL